MRLIIRLLQFKDVTVAFEAFHTAEDIAYVNYELAHITVRLRSRSGHRL